MRLFLSIVAGWIGFNAACAAIAYLLARARRRTQPAPEVHNPWTCWDCLMDIHEALAPVLYHPSSGLLDGEE
jgi:hypothetical protein